MSEAASISIIDLNRGELSPTHVLLRTILELVQVLELDFGGCKHGASVKGHGSPFARAEIEHLRVFFLPQFSHGNSALVSHKMLL